MAMTRGEYRVGVAFNPSGDATVAEIKRLAAAMIDLILELRVPVPDGDEDDDAFIVAMEHIGEVERLKALAVDAAEEAAMWAVKAATKPAPQIEV